MHTLPSDRFDVIIVGAGPAGVTAAMALGRAGFCVLLCEAGVFPGAENWSGAVMFAENLEHPEAFGKKLIEEAPYERRLVERGAYLYNGHCLLGATLHSKEAFRSCYTVLRPVYDRYLAETTREYGVVLASETTVQSLIRHRGSIIGVHTERGPAYADVVFLAEGDAAHLVTQEGYERVAAGAGERAPHFLQGVKEVISLPQDVLEERFGLRPGEGRAIELLLRNGSRRGRTVRLNMGAFLYTNRDSVSLGYVVPLDHLQREFEGDHNLLMEWFKGLPEIERWIDGGKLTSYGAKLIRGGGYREIPRLVDNGLAIGGAASGIGLDFPYPNFTGPATAMGLYFAQAVKAIAAESGGPGGKHQPGNSPYTEAALRTTYLSAVERSHYYRNVRYLRDWPDYVERTTFLFERQIDLLNNSAYLLSRRENNGPRRWWEWVRLLRRAMPWREIPEIIRDNRSLARTFGLSGMTRAAFTAGNVVRVLWNTVGALLPTGGSVRFSNAATDGAHAGAGIAEAVAHDGARLRATFRVLGGSEDAGRLPLLVRWYWKRFGSALASAFVEVYRNDDTALEDKLKAAARHVGARVSVWDLLMKPILGIPLLLTGALQVCVEWVQRTVLRWGLVRFERQPLSRLLDENRERLRLDEDAVRIVTPYEAKLATITYQEDHRSHIKVLWPESLAERARLADSALWHICPAKVYEVRHDGAGHPGVVVNFENCIKCESCWRCSDDVDWSRATQHRLIYQVYTPAQEQLHRALERRPEPHPRLGDRPPLWETLVSVTPGVELDRESAGALARLRDELRRIRSDIEAFGDALGSSPMVLDASRREHLSARIEAAANAFAHARDLWGEARLESVRAGLGELPEALWQEATTRFADMRRHGGEGRLFWAEVLGRQLLDHHLVGLDRCMEAVARGAEIAVLGPQDDGAWQRRLAWRAIEAQPALFQEDRERLRAQARALFDGPSLRALDRGTELSAQQIEWLRARVASVAEPRAHGRYCSRDLLIEELAALDPALAYLIASHLLVNDLLSASGIPQLEAIRTAELWTAIVPWGPRRLEVRADGVMTISAVSDFIPSALAQQFLIVIGTHGYLVNRAAEGVSLEDVGSVGLLGARIRRLRIDAAVPVKTVDLSALCDAADLEEPAAGEAFAGILGCALPDLLALVRGAAGYLLDRAREHAAGRVQFPGAFGDEAGRDAIGKFGAVKQMLAEMETHRYLLEAVSMLNVGGDENPWIGAAAAKVMLSEAFGPGPGSLSYNAGQVFGGTAFSEDDDIAKYYRDSAPFRFLYGHDDALRVQIGRRRMEALRGGGTLVPITQSEAHCLATAREHRLLHEAAERFERVRVLIENWAANLPQDAGDPLLLIVGSAIVRVLAVKVSLLRLAWRLEAGLPIEAMLEAVRLLADRLAADAPGFLDEADLVDEVVAVGDAVIEHGDLLPAPSIPDAEPYSQIITCERPYESGEWLRPFDVGHVRYVPEILSNDARLWGYWEDLEQELRDRFVTPRFDGLTYGRYLEQLHRIPEADIEYMVRRGFMRMPIPEKLGGEGALKAEYYILCMLIGRYGDAALSLSIMGNTSIGTTPAMIGLSGDLPRARAKLQRALEQPELEEEAREGIEARLAEYDRRERAGELFLRLIAAGYISAFALTEPTAGSDSGGVKTLARLQSRRVFRDPDGVLYFWLDEQGQRDRRNLVDADRIETDPAGRRILYRYDTSAEPAEIQHHEYDYDTDTADRMRFYMHGDRKVPFSDMAQVREGDDGPHYDFWVLNGAKMWVTNGRIAHCMALYARTEPEGVTGFLLDRHAEGLVVGADEEKLGQRGSPTNEVSLNSVRIPREGIIGVRGRGQVNALETLNTGRAGLAVTTHATLQEMLEDALAYLRGETAGGLDKTATPAARPLQRYWMGRVAEELVGTAGTTYELIGLLDNENTRSVRMESAIGKYYGTEAQHEVIDWMERLRGLEGQTWLHRIEKTRRDARVLNIYEGTNEVQRFLLLKDLVQRVLPTWRDRAQAAGEAAEMANPDLVAELEQIKDTLGLHLESAVERFGQQVWANVGTQPAFFALSEIAGLTKVIDAVLYRLEWCAVHEVPQQYSDRLNRVGRLTVRRALARARTLDRRYSIAWEALSEDQYPAPTRLGFLSLESPGATAEGWGRLPERLIGPVPSTRLQRRIDLAVLIKPVPWPAPTPRLADGAFCEPLYTLGPSDRAALCTALQLKSRDSDHIRVTAYALGGVEAVEVLRTALASGVDTAVHLELDELTGPRAVHDPRYVAEAFSALLERRPADVVLCGDTAADTGQSLLPAYLASKLGLGFLGQAERVAWADELAVGVRVSAEGWQGLELEQELPCVVATRARELEPTVVALADWLGAAAAEIEKVPVRTLVSGWELLRVLHRPRAIAASAKVERAGTPEQAAEVLIELAGSDGNSASDAAPPYGDRMLTLGEQPQQDDTSFLFVAPPLGDRGLSGAARAHVEVAARMAAMVELPLDVVLPIDGDESEAAAIAGAVIAAGEPRRVYAVTYRGISDFSPIGHLEWFEELWGMYRSRPRWLVGSAWAEELFTRFVARGLPKLEAGGSWAWYGVDAVRNGGSTVRVSTTIYGGAAHASAHLPKGGGLRVLTLGRSVQVHDESSSYGVPGSGESQVYLWTPQIEYDREADPLARLRRELTGAEPSLEDAEFIIDVGYGIGGRDGIEHLAEPLRRLLAEDMGLSKVMIGATRKVTQDLELLPAESQIGQTGLAVNPKLIIALAVSGAPQHVDYIGDRAVILSFNIDPEAPLMGLNEQRPRPLVHAIPGDVRETVPRFMAALRDGLRRSG